MSRYILVESRDPFDSRDSEHFYEIARGLKDSGNDVTLFLVQNGPDTEPRLAEPGAAEPATAPAHPGRARLRPRWIGH